MGGVVLLALGIVAVFTTENDAGTLALVAAGLLLLLVGITGMAVTKLRIGSNEFVLEKVRAAQEAYGRGEDAVAEQIVEQILQSTGPEGAPTPLARERARYEQDVFAIIERNLDAGWHVTRKVRTEDYRFDAVVSKPECSNIAVELFYAPGFTGRQLLSALITARNDPVMKLSKVLIVTAHADARGVTMLRRDLQGLGLDVRLVTWRPGEADAVVAQALSDLTQS